MPGMLSQAQNQPPSSGPDPQTPPPASPGAGLPPSGGATGPGQPQDVQALKDQAIQLVYGERFDQLIKMFQTNGPEKFPRSMAVAVNTAITEMEKKNGPIDPASAAEVGMDLMMKLLEDIIAGGVVPDTPLEKVQEAFPAILVMYQDSHPEVSKEDIQSLVKEVQNGLQSQGVKGAAQQTGSEPAATGPGVVPGGDPASAPEQTIPQPGGTM